MLRRRIGVRTIGLRGLGAALTLGGLAACAGAPPATPFGSGRVPAYNRPYQVHGRWYRPVAQPGYDVVGIASWYSYESGRTTADGERLDARIASAAHTTLPLPSWLEVTNLENGRSLVVRLNDRGPFVTGRLIDLSRAAAGRLGYLTRGAARVRVRYLGPAPAARRERDHYAALDAGAPDPFTSPPP